MIIIVVATAVLGLAILYYLLNSKQSNNASGTKAVAKKSVQRSGSIAIADKYKTISEVQKALRKSGLESSNLIIGIDFTKSNMWTGEETFGGKSLHFVAHNDVCIYINIYYIYANLRLFRQIAMLCAFETENIVVFRSLNCFVCRLPRRTLMTTIQPIIPSVP